MNRRKFLQTTAAFGGVIAVSPFSNASAFAKLLVPPPLPDKANVAFVKTTDRISGIKKALELLEFTSVRGKKIFLKPNFNSSDNAPGSTHNDTLISLIRNLHERGADQIAVGDRSGMGDTRQVMKRKEIFTMAEELQFDTVVLDELKADEWVMQRVENGHWQKGFAVPKPVLDSDGIIQTCCLKTHRYGGHFTMSLKNSVGFTAKYIPGDSYNYMVELHSSDHQRHMIAEVNTAYQPDLVVLDGIEAFVDGGPASGKKVNSGVILAGTDRVAIDAIGVAILRYFGTTSAVSRGAIFEQEQIARAVELGLGVDSPDKIELITDGVESKVYGEKILEILKTA